MPLKTCITFILCLLLVSFGLSAQGYKELSLDETIQTARKQSPDALQARNRFKASYWRYRYHRADYLPWLTANTTLADINRSYSIITLPDGANAFIFQSLMRNSMNLQVNQRIGLTGGSVFLNSGLQRIELFNAGGRQPVSYLSSPISIGISQSVLGFNELRWQKKIEPLYYTEARQLYVQAMEDISLKAVDLFFNVLLAQGQLYNAAQNEANSDTLYKIAQGRYSLGRIAENELLQLELNQLNSGLSVQQASISLGVANARLKTFLGMNPRDSLVLIVPKETDSLKVSLGNALNKALAHGTFTANTDRRRLEAARDVAEAKGRNGTQGNIFAQFGLNQNAPVLDQAYKNPIDQEQFTFGLQIPIVDWGKSKGAIEMAKAQQELMETILKQERNDFEQNVILQAAEFNLQLNQLTIARKADDVGQRRFFIAKQRYLLGKIGITDLNIAQSERDAAQIAYFEVLRNYWASYYRLRRITLYDFKTDAPLVDKVVGLEVGL